MSILKKRKDGLKIPNGLGCDFSTVDRGQWKYPQLCGGGGGVWTDTHTAFRGQKFFLFTQCLAVYQALFNYQFYPVFTQLSA